MADEQIGIEQDEELYEVLQFKADKGQEPLRIDRYLQQKLEGVSRSRIQLAAHAGNVYVNQKQVKPNYKVKPLDALQIVIPKPQEAQLIAEDIPLEIVYEDDDLIIINKQAGLVVHPGLGNYRGTLVNALLHHFEQLPVKEDLSRPGLVHRLDKDTSGLMVIAKTELTMTIMAKKFFERDIDRKYLSLVWGDMEADEGEINAPIGRHPRLRQQMAIVDEEDGGKHAITRYKVIERFGYTTLVECKLQTGRTHQIRVHMKHIGHTVFNDERYGGNRILKGTIYTKYQQFADNCFALCPRQALHAYRLGFRHPISNENMLWEAEPPADMKALIEKWRIYSTHLKKDE